jgi:hypothetical protein
MTMKIADDGYSRNGLCTMNSIRFYWLSCLDPLVYLLPKTCIFCLSSLFLPCVYLKVILEMVCANLTLLAPLVCAIRVRPVTS